MKLLFLNVSNYIRAWRQENPTTPMLFALFFMNGIQLL